MMFPFVYINNIYLLSYTPQSSCEATQLCSFLDSRIITFSQALIPSRAVIVNSCTLLIGGGVVWVYRSYQLAQQHGPDPALPEYTEVDPEKGFKGETDRIDKHT